MHGLILSLCESILVLCELISVLHDLVVALHRLILARCSESSEGIVRIRSSAKAAAAEQAQA